MGKNAEEIRALLLDALFKEDDVTAAPTLIHCAGRRLLSEGSFALIGGLPKSRKSFVLSAMAAAILSGDETLNFTGEPGKIVWIDTEQRPAEFSQKMAMVKRWIGADVLPESLRAFLFRRHPGGFVFDAIPALIEAEKPKYIFLDGVTDLVLNVNDFEEANKVITFLKRITDETGVSIVVVIHLSKMGGFTLGALGAGLDRASESVLVVERDQKTGFTNIAPRFMRSDDHFEAFSIAYDKDSDTYAISGEAPKSRGGANKFDLSAYDDTALYNMALSIFEGSESLSYSELIDQICALFGVGKTIAKQRIFQRLLMGKFISKTSSGEYRRIVNNRRASLTNGL